MIWTLENWRGWKFASYKGEEQHKALKTDILELTRYFTKIIMVNDTQDTRTFISDID